MGSAAGNNARETGGAPPEPRRLRVVSGLTAGWERLLDSDRLTLGREVDNSIVFTDTDVSRHHAELRRENGEYLIRDLGSANGTHVNGKRVKESRLAPGDILQLGMVQTRYEPAPVVTADTTRFETELREAVAKYQAVTVELTKARAELEHRRNFALGEDATPLERCGTAPRTAPPQRCDPGAQGAPINTPPLAPKRQPPPTPARRPEVLPIEIRYRPRTPDHPRVRRSRTLSLVAIVVLAGLVVVLVADWYRRENTQLEDARRISSSTEPSPAPLETSTLSP